MGPLSVSYPRVSSVMSNKESSVSDYFVWGKVVGRGVCLLGGFCVTQRSINMESCL